MNAFERWLDNYQPVGMNSGRHFPGSAAELTLWCQDSWNAAIEHAASIASDASVDSFAQAIASMIEKEKA